MSINQISNNFSLSINSCYLLYRQWYNMKSRRKKKKEKIKRQFNLALKR